MWLLLVLILWKGELKFQAQPMPSYEKCIEAIPYVAKRQPDTASLSCLYLRTEKDI